jgi:carboxyl-terminal processing protease
VLQLAIAYCVFCSPYRLSTARAESEPTLDQAQKAEIVGDWNRAAEVYRQLYARERGHTDLRQAYQRCLRRAHQVARHRDPSFQQQVRTMGFPDALLLYGEGLSKLQQLFVSGEKAEPQPLFREGLEELRNAFTDRDYCREVLGSQSVETLELLKTEFVDQWHDRQVNRAADLMDVVRTVAEEAHNVAGIPPTAVVMEFLCGACAGLDEFSSYLTPAQLREITASWKGKCVTAGLEIAIVEHQAVVSRVYPGTKARAQGIHSGDRVLRISGIETAGLNLEEAKELLKGEADSALTLVIAPAGGRDTREIILKRQAAQLPSISEPRFLDERLAIAYLRVFSFQESTIQEIDEAIAQLSLSGMRVFMLDLRGNEGGLFDVAVQVAERFISAGLIVSTHGAPSQPQLLQPRREHFDSSPGGADRWGNGQRRGAACRRHEGSSACHARWSNNLRQRLHAKGAQVQSRARWDAPDRRQVLFAARPRLHSLWHHTRCHGRCRSSP